MCGLRFGPFSNLELLLPVSMRTPGPSGNMKVLAYVTILCTLILRVGLVPGCIVYGYCCVISSVVSWQNRRHLHTANECELAAACP